jgi:hypothetical protein
MVGYGLAASGGGRPMREEATPTMELERAERVIGDGRSSSDRFVKCQ